MDDKQALRDGLEIREGVPRWSGRQAEVSGLTEGWLCGVEESFKIELPHELVRMYRERNGGALDGLEAWGTIVPITSSAIQAPQFAPLCHWPEWDYRVTRNDLWWVESEHGASTRIFPLVCSGPDFYALNYNVAPGREPDVIWLRFATRESQVLAENFAEWIRNLAIGESTSIVEPDAVPANWKLLHHEPEYLAQSSSRDLLTSELYGVSHEDRDPQPREQWLYLDESGQLVLVGCVEVERTRYRWQCHMPRVFARDLQQSSYGGIRREEGCLRFDPKDDGRIRMRHSLELGTGDWFNRSFDGYPQAAFLTTQDPDDVVDVLDQLLTEDLVVEPANPSASDPRDLVVGPLKPGRTLEDLPDDAQVEARELLEFMSDREKLNSIMSIFDPNKRRPSILRRPPKHNRPVSELSIEEAADEVSRWMRYFGGGARDVQNLEDAQSWLANFGQYRARLLEVWKSARSRAPAQTSCLINDSRALADQEIRGVRHDSQEASGLLDAYWKEILEESSRPEDAYPEVRRALERFRDATQDLRKHLSYISREQQVKPAEADIRRAIHEYGERYATVRKLSRDLPRNHHRWFIREFRAAESEGSLRDVIKRLLTRNRHLFLEHQDLFMPLLEVFQGED